MHGGRTAATDQGGQHRHRPGLDGLRGIAVALVVAYHLWPDVVPGGFLGVSLFFTLSGYLITGLLLAEHDRHGRIDLRSFWGRRFRRLLPAALVTLAAVALVAPFVASPPDLHRQVVAALAEVYNWRILATGGGYGSLFADPSPIEHFWSLAIEEQFYLVFPVLAVVLLRRGRRAFTVGVSTALAASVGLVLFGGLGHEVVYLSTPTRAAEILAGALLAVAWPLIRAAARLRPLAVALGAVGLAGLVAASVVVSYDDPVVARGLLPLVAVGSCAAIAGAADRRADAVLGTAVLAWLGRRSYAVYLIHWPLVVWLPSDAVAVLALTLALAELSHRVVEAPIRSRRVLPRPRLAAAGGAAAVLTVAVWSLAPPITPPSEAARGGVETVAPLAESVADPPPPPAGSSAPAPPTSPVPAAIPTTPTTLDPTRPLTLWFVGDSQIDGLMDWMTGRRDPSKDFISVDGETISAYPYTWAGRELTIVDLAIPGCDGGDGARNILLGGKPGPEDHACVGWQERWQRALDGWGQPDAVVWMLGYTTVSVPRSFTPDGPDVWTRPVDPEWRDWWTGTADARLSWLGDHLPGTEVVWTTPFEPVRDEFPVPLRPDDDLWPVLLASLHQVVALQHQIAPRHPNVALEDFGTWVSSAGPGGERLVGTVDGIHWGRTSAEQAVLPWLLEHAVEAADRRQPAAG